MNSTFPDLASFKAWAKQNPDARRLLKEIIFRWRGSSARLRGDPVPWAAYPLVTWRGWTSLSRSTLDRRLRDLAEVGLVERGRHRFAGCTICPWLRPTDLALRYVGTPADLARLRVSKPTAVMPLSEASVEAPHEALAEAMAEATDYTTIPSSASIATKPLAPANKFTGGKGKAGENEDFVKELATKELAAMAKKAGHDQLDPADPYWEGAVQSKAKKLHLLLAKFPKLKGKHEPHVKHPSEMHSNWSSWSLELLAKRQAIYEEYVANWYTGNGGKPSKSSWQEWTEKDDAAFWEAVKKAEATSEDDWVPGPWKSGSVKAF